MLKTCAGCKQALGVEAFTKNAAKDDGLSVSCRACQKAYRISAGLQKPDGWERKTSDVAAYQKAWRQANPDKVRGYERKKGYDPAKERRKYERKMIRLRGEGYVVGDPKNRLQGVDPAYVKLKRATRRTTRRAIKQGKLVRQPCQVCGVAEVEAHHTDYAKPLEVQWLCKEHHKAVHC